MGCGYTFLVGGVILGRETVAGEWLVTEGADKEGVAEGGIAGLLPWPGGEREWSPFRR